MSASSKKENLLTSWKEIAAYLNCNPRTCRRWEKQLGLPVKRLDKLSKYRVHADTKEIDKWLKERFNQNAIPQRTTPRKIYKYSVFFFLFLFVTAGGIYLFITKTSKMLQPVDFKIDESRLVIFNEKGKELWRYNTEIKNLADEESYKNHFQFKRINIYDLGRREFPHIMIQDLNSDNQAEVLFSTQTQNEFGEGELLCFDNEGNLLWKFIAGREMEFGSKVYSSDYRIRGFDVCDFNDDGNFEIVVVSRHRTYFPQQVILLNTKGDVIGEYWNSGYFIDYAFVDLNEDGKKEIIFAGGNNEYGKGCLVVFDPEQLKGGSPQINDYKCKELEPGTEKYYILFPRTDFDIFESPIESIYQLDILKNRRISLTTVHSNIIYELNFNLKLQDVYFSHRFKQKHQKALFEGKINSEINDEYKKKLEQGLLYYDGQTWTSKPTMNQ